LEISPSNRMMRQKIIADAPERILVQQRLRHSQNLVFVNQTDKWKSFLWSISEQFLQVLSRITFARILVAGGNERAADEIEIFAEVTRVFFGDGFGTSVATLMRRARIVAGTVEANAEVGTAPVAAFTSSGLHRKCPLPAAFPAMACHAGVV
jgi:hypothetical protein